MLFVLALLLKFMITKTFTSQKMEGDSQNSYSRYEIRMSATRKYEYYVYNVLLIIGRETMLYEGHMTSTFGKSDAFPNS